VQDITQSVILTLFAVYAVPGVLVS